MKKRLLYLTLVCLFLLALGGTAGAQPPTPASLATSPPTVSAIDPATAYNDIDTLVTITGADFSTDATGTILPTATLGSIPLIDMTFGGATSLAATVPWGMDPGAYDLSVVNPDGGSATLPGAFTVTPGIGQWNGGTLFGGWGQKILMKPGDPTTLFVRVGNVGVFRSKDAGEHWSFLTGLVAAQADLAVDPCTPPGCTPTSCVATTQAVCTARRTKATPGPS